MPSTPAVSPWRYWLIDVPARIVDFVNLCYHYYLLVVFTVAAVTCIPMVLTISVLWFGFGIRWGW
jgi:hypothetical protein